MLWCLTALLRQRFISKSAVQYKGGYIAWSLFFLFFPNAHLYPGMCACVFEPCSGHHVDACVCVLCYFLMPPWCHKMCVLCCVTVVLSRYMQWSVRSHISTRVGTHTQRAHTHIHVIRVMVAGELEFTASWTYRGTLHLFER